MFVKKLVTIAAVVLVLFFVVSCSTDSKADFVGTWTMTAGIAPFTVTYTLALTETAMSMTATGLQVGAFEGTVDSFSESAGHMQITAKSSSGSFATTVGEVSYITYSITGGQLSFSSDTTAYPASSTAGSGAMGPFTKS